MNEINITLNEKEQKLLYRILGNEVSNANTVYPELFELDPSEYKTLCSLFNKAGKELK